MQEEWIDIRDKTPIYGISIKVQIQIPCYFDCNKDGSALTAWIDGKYVDGRDWKCIYPFPIDLTDKLKKWKWKLNENDKNHWEDIEAWMDKHNSTNIPENYHYYRRRKNEFKTFKRELPVKGTSIILQFEMYGAIGKINNELWFMGHGPHFICTEMQMPITINPDEKNIVWRWKDDY